MHLHCLRKKTGQDFRKENMSGCYFIYCLCALSHYVDVLKKTEADRLRS